MMDKEHEIKTSGDVLEHIDDTIISVCHCIQRAVIDGETVYELGEPLSGLAELINARSGF